MQDDDVEVSGDQRFKLRPTRYDRKAFAAVMDPDAGAIAAKDGVSVGYRYFVEQLERWAMELPVGEEDEYFDALRDTSTSISCSLSSSFSLATIRRGSSSR